MFAKLFLLTSILFIFFCVLTSNAQTSVNDSSSPYRFHFIDQQYISNRAENLLLYNGVEYAYSYPRVIGHPFFLTDTFQKSSIVYDGVLYKNIPLAYDLVNNEVVIKNKNNFLIDVKREKVNSFLLKNHLFVFLSYADIKNDMLQPDIYEVYDYSSVIVFIKHEKKVQQASNAADPDYFSDYNYFFIKRNNDYFSVKNESALLTIFNDKSNEIKTYLHQQHVSFKKNPEATVLKAAAYYAQLKK